MEPGNDNKPNQRKNRRNRVKPVQSITGEQSINPPANDGDGNEIIGEVNADSGNTNKPTFTIGGGEQPKRGRGRPPGSTSKTTKKNEVQKGKITKEIEETAEMLMSLFQAQTTSILKVDTSFTEGEYKAIKPPLERTLARMDTSRLEKYSAIIDPIIIGIALFAWSNRVIPKPQKVAQ